MSSAEVRHIRAPHPTLLRALCVCSAAALLVGCGKERSTTEAPKTPDVDAAVLGDVAEAGNALQDTGSVEASHPADAVTGQDLSQSQTADGEPVSDATELDGSGEEGDGGALDGEIDPNDTGLKDG